MASTTTARRGTSSFVACNRATSAFSWFSAEVGGIQRHTLVADFKNKNSVSKSIKLEKFLEPPQRI